MRAAVYLRISVDKSGEELGVTRQREDAERLVAQRGWTLTRTFVENGVSASGKAARPEFTAMIGAIHAGEIDAVVAWALDRLARNARDRLALVEACQANRVTIALVRGSDMDPTTPSGRFAIGILGEVAQMEIATKSDRQRRAAEQAAAAGRPLKFNHRPFGYRPDKVTPEPREAAAVVAACEQLLSGASLRSIARQWNDDPGLVPAQGAQRWLPSTVRTVLLNPRNAAVSTYRGEEMAAGEWEPLVPEPTWRAVKALLTDPARTTPKGGRTLLGGLARCRCGTPVYAGRNSRGVRVLRCLALHRAQATDGGHISRKAEPVESYVTDLVVARLARPDAADLLRDEARVGPDVDALRAQARVLRARFDEIAAEFADGTIPAPMVRTMTARVQSDLAAVEAELADAGRVSVLAPLVDAADVRARWDGLDLDRQRAVIDLLMAVTLRSPGMGAHARRFDPDTVEIKWKGGGR